MNRVNDRKYVSSTPQRHISDLCEAQQLGLRGWARDTQQKIKLNFRCELPRVLMFQRGIAVRSHANILCNYNTADCHAWAFGHRSYTRILHVYTRDSLLVPSLISLLFGALINCVEESRIQRPHPIVAISPPQSIKSSRRQIIIGQRAQSPLKPKRLRCISPSAHGWSLWIRTTPTKICRCSECQRGGWSHSPPCLSLITEPIIVPDFQDPFWRSSLRLTSAIPPIPGFPSRSNTWSSLRTSVRATCVIQASVPLQSLP